MKKDNKNNNKKHEKFQMRWRHSVFVSQQIETYFFLYSLLVTHSTIYIFWWKIIYTKQGAKKRWISQIGQFLLGNMIFFKNQNLFGFACNLFQLEMFKCNVWIELLNAMKCLWLLFFSRWCCCFLLHTLTFPMYTIVCVVFLLLFVICFTFNSILLGLLI